MYSIFYGVNFYRAMGLKLYKKDTSAPCRSVFMVLEALKIKDVEYIDVNLQQREQFNDDFLKMNPQHTVPTLKDGDFVVWDSHAIATYLVSEYGKNDSLYPKEPKKRAPVDQRLHFNNGILNEAMRGAVLPLIYQGEKNFRPESLTKIKTAYDFTEKFLTKTWLAGDNVTVADICCLSTICTLNEAVPIDAEVYPNLAAWFARCKKQDFYVKGGAPSVKKFKDWLEQVQKQ